MRAREEPVLQHPPRRRIDDDGDAIDSSGGRMRFEIEQGQGAQRSDIAHRCRQLDAPRMHVRAAPDPSSARVMSPSRTCSTAAPRSRRSSLVDNGSSSRVRTNDSGSSPSSGHSSSSVPSKRSSASVGMSGRTSSPRASARQISAGRPTRATRSAGGSAASSPSVRSPQRLTSLDDRRGLVARRRGRAERRDGQRGGVQEVERQRRQRGGLGGAGNDREPGPGPRQHHRRGLRPRDGGVDVNAARAPPRRSSSPMRRVVPSSRSSPLMSMTTPGSCSSYRGENSPAIAASTSSLG